MLLIMLMMWWAAGFVIFIVTMKSIDPEITVRDLICGCFCAWAGPVNVVWWAAYAKKPWLDKKVF